MTTHIRLRTEGGRRAGIRVARREHWTPMPPHGFPRVASLVRTPSCRPAARPSGPPRCVRRTSPTMRWPGLRHGQARFRRPPPRARKRLEAESGRKSLGRSLGLGPPRFRRTARGAVLRQEPRRSAHGTPSDEQHAGTTRTRPQPTPPPRPNQDEIQAKPTVERTAPWLPPSESRAKKRTHDFSIEHGPLRSGGVEMATRPFRSRQLGNPRSSFVLSFSSALGACVGTCDP